MKKMLGRAAMLMMAAAMAGDRSIYDMGYRRSSGNIRRRELTEGEKRMLAQKYQEHEFVIHGEKIMARNKKTAMKIYANRQKKG